MHKHAGTLRPVYVPLSSQIMWCSVMGPKYAVVLIFAAVLGLSWALDGYEDQYGTVEYVNILFRHGARTPDGLAPGDPHNDMKNWPEGLGQLTREGILQHYDLGRWLYKRYRHLFPRETDRSRVNEAVKIVSTDWPRTLMSANAETYGLFPIITDAGRWFGLPTFPVPVHSMPKETDKLLEVTADCKRYTYLVKEFEQSKDFNEILDKYQMMTDQLVHHTRNQFSNLDFYMELYTTYAIEESRDLPLPDWVRKWYPKPMIEPTILSFVVPTWTTDMKRLRGGPFIKEATRNFWDKITQKIEPPSKNISMYSAHDTTISAVLNSMGVFNWLPPPFASMVLIELRKKPEGPVVMVWYKNDTKAEPELLTIPKCPSACPLTRFEKLMKPVVPENWAEECNNVPLNTRLDDDNKDPIHYQTFGRRKDQSYYKRIQEEQKNKEKGSSGSISSQQRSQSQLKPDSVVFE